MIIFIKSLSEVPYDIDSHKSDSSEIVSMRMIHSTTFMQIWFFRDCFSEDDSPDNILQRLSLYEVPYEIDSHKQYSPNIISVRTIRSRYA